MFDKINTLQDKYSTRKLTNNELIRAIRNDISAEYEAVNIYMSHAEATNNASAKKILTSIANEERIHAGEFERLLDIITTDEKKYAERGKREVNEMLEKKKTRKIIKKRK